MRKQLQKASQPLEWEDYPWLAEFEDLLKSGRTVTWSCQLAGISKARVYMVLKAKPEVRERLQKWLGAKVKRDWSKSPPKPMLIGLSNIMDNQRMPVTCLAGRRGVATKTMWKYKNCVTAPNDDLVIARMANCLNVDVEELYVATPLIPKQPPPPKPIYKEGELSEKTKKFIELANAYGELLKNNENTKKNVFLYQMNYRRAAKNTSKEGFLLSESNDGEIIAVKN